MRSSADHPHLITTQILNPYNYTPLLFASAQYRQYAEKWKSAIKMSGFLFHILCIDAYYLLLIIINYSNHL